jgi:hypothetical protein
MVQSSRTVILERIALTGDWGILRKIITKAGFYELSRVFHRHQASLLVSQYIQYSAFEIHAKRRKSYLANGFRLTTF